MSTTISKLDTADITARSATYDGSQATPPNNLSNAVNSPSSIYKVSKGILDFTSALFLLAISTPLFFIIAMAIKLTSRGPVFFKQQRLGINGKKFWCYKFRTMIPDAEAVLLQHPELWQRFTETYKLKDDPRVTRIGKLLRKLSLDELPQLINVLKGEMSLIGPRPIVPSEVHKYGIYGEKLLSVKPGCSGMWQAYGRSDTSYEQRVQFDMIYIDTRSLALDVKLLCMTVVAVITRRGAQ